MNRLLLILTLGALCLHCAISDSAVAQRPNIIYVMADDLGYGDLGCYGQQQIQTPHIDHMATEGMKWTDYYAGSTVCAPSRCVLMTGLHLGHCFIRGNGKEGLRPEDVTVAELLQQAGYTCGMFGKWGLGAEGTTGLPSLQGFDEFVGYLDQTHAHNYYPTFLNHNDDRFSLTNVVPDEGQYGQGVASEKNEYSHDIIFTAALQFLEANHERPFFLYLPVTIPHANNQAGKAGMEVPSYGQYVDKDWPEPQKGTAAMISLLDANMGTLFQTLKTYGIDENTIVFFTSDNGPHKEGGNDPLFFDSNGPLRGIKRDLYEGGIRVPMIVRWPGKIKAGSTISRIASHVDLLATCCDLADIETPKNVDSVSMVPALLGDDSPLHDFLYWEFYEGNYKQAVRMGPWKMVRIGNDYELFNLEQDLGEEQDVASAHPERLAQLRTVAEQSHEHSDRWKINIKPSKK